MKITNTTEKAIIRPPKTNEPVFLCFENKEEKEKYLKKEWAYCAANRDAYMIASVGEKSKKLREYLNKRVSFARISGFAPLVGNSKFWVFTLDPNTKLA